MLRSLVKFSHSMLLGEDGTQIMKMSSICLLKSSKFSLYFWSRSVRSWYPKNRVA